MILFSPFSFPSRCSGNKHDAKTLEIIEKFASDMQYVKQWVDANPEYLLILVSDHGGQSTGEAAAHGSNTDGNEAFLAFYVRFHLPSPISHLPSPISHLPSPISHLPSPISHLPSCLSPLASPPFLIIFFRILHWTPSLNKMIGSTQWTSARPSGNSFPVLEFLSLPNHAVFIYYKLRNFLHKIREERRREGVGEREKGEERGIEI
jgi:hypothetical protein